jgi:hypothetical protein
MDGARRYSRCSRAQPLIDEGGVTEAEEVPQDEDAIGERVVDAVAVDIETAAHLLEVGFDVHCRGSGRAGTDRIGNQRITSETEEVPDREDSVGERVIDAVAVDVELIRRDPP